MCVVRVCNFTNAKQWANGIRRTSGSDGSISSSSAPGYRASGVSRSSLNLLRRKKITRSASLEDDDERRRALGFGGGTGMPAGGVRGRGGSGSGSSSGHAHDLSNGMLRGRGRDGNLALSTTFVRSQSVSDEVMAMDHSADAM